MKHFKDCQPKPEKNTEESKENKIVDDTKPEDLKCQFCNTQYENQDAFLEHIIFSSCGKKKRKIKSPIERSHRERKIKLVKIKSKNRKIIENNGAIGELSCNRCDDFPTTNNFKDIFDHFLKEHKYERSCIICEAKYRKRESIYKHYEVHSDNTYCKVHFMAFNSSEELEAHLNIPNHERMCIQCDLLLKTTKIFSAHRLRKHIGKEKHKCPHCPLYYENRHNVRRHILRFHEKFRFMCEQCGNTYTTRTNLRLHVARAHEGRALEKFEPVCCDECGKMFGSKKTLFNHKYKKHWGHKSVCRHCKQTFPDKEKLEEHIKESGHTLFECEICQKQYVNNVKLLQHIESHKEEKKTKYKNVGKRRRWWQFRIEGAKPIVARPQDQNPPYICSICKQEFKSLHTMTQHKKIHFSEKPFKCDFCGKCFRVKRFLDCHVNIHTGNRPYKCQYCDKAFLNDSSKYQHEMIHTGKRPHKCPACDKGFISSSAMKKHIQIHMKDPKSIAYLSEYVKPNRPKIQTFSSEQEALAASAVKEENYSNPELLGAAGSSKNIMDQNKDTGSYL